MHTWTIHIDPFPDGGFYLGVKGVELKLVGAFKGLRVDLLESDPVELTLKDVDLLNIFVCAPNVVALPCQCQLGVFCTLSRICGQKSNRSHLCCFILLCVVKHKERDPEPVHVFKGERVL